MKKQLLFCCLFLLSVLTRAQLTIKWQRQFGGTGTDQSFSTAQTNDGGYILTGKSNSSNGSVTGNHGLNDVWLVKTDSLGILQWQKSLGGTAEDRGYSVIQTSDGGYVVAGMTASNNGDVSGNH